MRAELIELYKKKGILRGGELYLDVDSSLEFLRESRKSGLCVIGIEGFRRENGYLEPLIDQIADFSNSDGKSWSRFNSECNESSKVFIEQLPKDGDIVLNFTLIAKEEWEETRKVS